jgi:hypothetical protein
MKGQQGLLGMLKLKTGMLSGGENNSKCDSRIPQK